MVGQTRGREGSRAVITVLWAAGATVASYLSGLAGIWTADRLHKWWHVG